MQHPVPAPANPALLRRLGMSLMLVFLWLFGLSWNLAEAQALPNDSELAFFMPASEPSDLLGLANDSGLQEQVVCRKPVQTKAVLADLLCHETHPAMLQRWQVCRVLAPGQRVAALSHPFLPEAAQLPLLRPPAALG